MKRLHVEVEGRTVEVLAQKISGVLWYHLDGQTYQYTPASQRGSGASGQGAGDPSQILAPMPGKVIKVLAQPGDSVKEGQTLVVMEAMKMEYNLKAAQDAKVKSIKCSENQTVGLGDMLVELDLES